MIHSKMPGAHSHGSVTGEEFAGGPIVQGILRGRTPQPLRRSQDWTEQDDYPAYLVEKKAIDV